MEKKDKNRSRRRNGGNAAQALPKLGTGSNLFWFVTGLGWVERQELQEILEWARERGEGVVPVPPYHESDLPPGSVPDMSSAAEDAAMTCMAEALFQTLRAKGEFRRLENTAERAEALLRQTRDLLAGK